MENKPPASKPSRQSRVAVSKEIDENLKRVYTASMSDEVPDRFLKLLAELRAKESKS